jgi:hypothetical protein
LVTIFILTFGEIAVAEKVYYDNSDEGQRFQSATIAEAEAVDEKFDQVATGLSEAEQDTRRALKFPFEPGMASQEFSVTVLQRRNKVMGFDGEGNLAVKDGFAWRGDWATGTDYLVNDVFRDPVSKNLYLVQVFHTSTVLANNIANGLVSLSIDVSEVEAAKALAQNAASAASQSSDESDASASASETSANASESARDTTVAARDTTVAARDVATDARDAAQLAQSEGEAARDAAVVARNVTTVARDVTTSARDAAQLAQSEGEAARDTAVAARNVTTSARDVATDARDAAQLAQSESEAARDAAVVARNVTTDARDVATDARDAAAVSASEAAASALSLDAAELIYRNAPFTGAVIPRSDTTAVPLQATAQTTGKIASFRQGAGAGTERCAVNNDGGIVSQGDITALSDRRLKTNLAPISDALARVKALSGYTYTRADTGAEQTGLVAQELLAVLPQAVGGGPTEENPDAMYAVAYGNVVGLLVEAIKEQQVQIDDLKSRVSQREGY